MIMSSMAMESQAHPERPHNHHLAVPITTFEDDEWGGLRRPGYAVLWKGYKEPETSDINDAFERLKAAKAGLQPLDIDAEVITIEDRIFWRQRRRVAPLIGKILRFKINEWA